MRRFGLKMGIDFTHFGLKSRMVFEETKEVYERNGRFVNKKEREICECWLSNLSNDDIIL